MPGRQSEPHDPHQHPNPHQGDAAKAAKPGQGPKPPKPGSRQPGAKGATDLTKQLNSAVVLPNPDPEQQYATQRLIEALPKDFTVFKADGKTPVWSMAAYQNFLVGSAPETVNPSLWRNALLNMNVGLYYVVPDAVYQVRGMDLSNITFIEDPTQQTDQVIVLDPLVSEECAAAAWDIYTKWRGPRTIAAVNYSHSHVDHYGGVRGLFGPDGPDESVKFIAPDGFLEHAVSENVYAGTAMARRALFMYGMTIEKDAQGQVDAGLGKTSSTGTIGVIAPTPGWTISESTPVGQPVQIGPFNIEFQVTPGTEAPSEMNFYLPDIRTMCMAENATPTLHNLYSLRGAQVRDAKAWSDYLNQTIADYGDRTDTMFASHFWPRWNSPGGSEIVDFWTHQADMYRYIHDQTLRITNSGRTLIEVAEDLDQSLPPNLANQWYNHGYYGTTNHNIKAVYQRYIGWFDGNPAHLHNLPPEKVGPRYVAAIGTADDVIRIAKKAFLDPVNGVDDYRWAAELLTHVVFADPGNIAARELQADVLEQLGYQAESGPWRNFYLAGAEELRYRKNPPAVPGRLTPGMLEAMPIDMVFDYLGIRLYGSKVNDQPMLLGFMITDGVEGDPLDNTLQLRNSVLVYQPQAPVDPDALYRLTRANFNLLVTGAKTPAQLQSTGDIEVLTGTITPLQNFFTTLLDPFNEDFGITTP
ncbi:alkyl/aryl-sulfatase [Yinghuangia soli]|uniref:MBL fold metallo-hydrolase n=1 Tax=Yinghuangia soli TaxID=2908204 RepID=A0AA41Q590_9ACTN|nr:alkyl sulfatase dimerization domain-containing protein [Yinghuangia soli]MCF2530367.1 MBL fold metallo-hydrolase [Yinghuangia soli]